MVRNGVHGVPQATADQTLASREEEASSDEDVEFGGVGEGRRNRVEIEGDG